MGDTGRVEVGMVKVGKEEVSGGNEVDIGDDVEVGRMGITIRPPLSPEIVLEASTVSAEKEASDMTEGKYCNRDFLYGPVEDQSTSYCIVLRTGKT